jgi:subtilisin-like proprotein convertase family protein
MLKHVIIMLLGVASFSLNGQALWTKSEVNKFRSASDEDRLTMPSAYQAYELAFDDIVKELSNAPNEKMKVKSVEGMMMSLPMADGSFEIFEIFDAPVMASKLAAKFSSIKSYKGYSTTDKSRNLRLDVGPYGFHAAIHSTDGVVYIDPYAKGNKDQYLVYDVADYMSQIEMDVPLCGTKDDLKDLHFDDIMQTRSVEGEIPLRVYRIAIACTGEWGAVRGTPENAMADIVTGVNRMNQIFENELAIRVVLINNNELLLNFDGDTDPYENSDSGSDMLALNTFIINNKVGNNAYDLGHVYARSCDTGGIARLSSLCDNTSKGGAVTCHYSNNLDYMAANVTSHEIGHQMSAQHTFNNCNGNESLGNGFEPGSGSSIMSYGGLCGGGLNVVGVSDIYYHAGSLIQIYFHTRDGGIADGCAEKIETSNIEPVISLSYEDNFSIPENTYFVLEGSATDANDDNLTYQWDGFNAGPQSPLGAPIGTAPRFRSFPARTSPVRFFPSPDNILAGNFDRTEVMPVGNMDLDFIFTARDNNAEAGTAVYEKIKFKTVATSEKFEITSQQTSGTSVKFGDPLDVTWNVAGTDVTPVNAPSVDIYFNTDNANNFSFDNMEVLAKGVPNSGSATVYMPNKITFDGRIIVKASNSIFFTINKGNIKVEEQTDASVFFTPDPVAQSVCLPTTTSVEISTAGFAGIEGDVALSVSSGLPDGATATFNPSTVTVGESSTMTIDYSGSTPSDRFDVTVKANVEGVDEFERDIILFVNSTDHSAMAGISPVNGDSGVGVAPDFTWSESPNADSYTIEIATSPAFGSSVYITESNMTDTEFSPLSILDKSTVYYWRVTAKNVCGEGTPSKINAFSTEVLACSAFSPPSSSLPINITQSGSPTITSEVAVTGGTIADVNVTKFIGEHDNNKDMVVTLISPSGTRVIMFSKICNQSDFNCTFDDASNSSVKCPLNAAGKTYRPKDKFEAFNGEQASGVWTLEIDDTASGNGGRLNSFTLEVCSGQSVESPFIVNNNEILLPWNDTKTISTADLKVEDSNNSAGDLKYTIVDLPVGQLKFNDVAVAIGDQFSQSDIDSGKLVYTSGGWNYDTYFSFTVIDGEGGFLGINNFDIIVNNPEGTFDPVIASNISVYPVPANDRLTIDLTESSETFTSYDIVNINGQVLSTGSINSKMILMNVSQYPAGIYIVNIKNEQYSIPKRIIVE